MSAQDDLRAEIVRRWQEGRPIAYDAALAIADDVLKNSGAERTQFRDWFEKHGQTVLDRINHG